MSRLDSLSMVSIDTLDAAVIRDEKTIRQIVTQTSLQRIDGSQIGRNFAVLGTPDLIKTLQMMPGVSGGAELSSGLYVRGGDGSDNLFLLDQVPMYQISHFVGMFSSFNTDVIDYADFYKGGFPARFGGRLSSVVDVGVKDGDFNKWHGTVSLGLVDGHVQIEGPIIPGKTSINFGARRTWTDIVKSIAMLFIKNPNTEEMAGKTHYDFGDFNLKLVHKFSPVSKLSWSSYYGQDLLKAGLVVNQREDNSSTRADLDFNLKWGNILSTLTWDRQWSETFDMEASLFYTNYTSRMEALINAKMVEVDEEGNVTNIGLNLFENNLSRVYDIGAKVNFFSKRWEGHHIRFGGSGLVHTYDPSRDSGIKVNMNGMPVTDMTPDKQSKHYLGGEMAAYAEDEITLGRRWRLNLGLRDALYLVDGKAYNRIEPRAAVKFMATDYLDFKGSFSTMNQFAHQVSAVYIDLPTNLWMPSTAKVKPMNSNQYVLGGTLKLPVGVSVDIEAFYKSMTHLYEYTGTNAILPQIDRWEEVFEEGIGRAYGTELSIEYESKKFQAVAYYTLSKSERLFRTFSHSWYPDRFDNRHKVTLTASYHFNKHFELYGAWLYHSGNRFTGKTGVIWNGENELGYELYGSPNNFELPAYHRMDVGLNFHKKTRHGFDSTTTISLYNAYNHVNPMFGFTEQHEGRMVGVSYGIIPIIPTISFCLKF